MWGIGWRRRDETEAAIAPLPQDPIVQAYFNYAQASEYRDPYRDISRPGDNLEQVILDTIDDAQYSIDIAVQELNLPLIAQALVAKQRQGVAVRVIVEHQYRRPWGHLIVSEVQKLKERDRLKYHAFLQFADLNHDGQIQGHEALQRDAMYILEQGNIPLIDDTADGSKGSGLMHHKFVVVDRQTVLTGSANFTLSGIHGDFHDPASLGNANHVVVIQNEAIAQQMSAEFDLMWGDGPGGHEDSLFGLQKPYRPPYQVQVAPGTAVTLQFSPVSGDRYSWDQSVNGLINQTLEQAETSIDMALFVFSDQRLSHTLYQKSQQRLMLRALIDSGFIYRSYSEALDMMGVELLNQRCKYDEDNRPWPTALKTVGTPQLADGDRLHHKFAVIDQAIVITGTQNWSDSANYRNDETAIIISSDVVSAHFLREFERLYEVVSFGVPHWLHNSIQEQRDRCFNAST